MLRTCGSTGFDWTPELANSDVEEDIRVETDTLRGGSLENTLQRSSNTL